MRPSSPRVEIKHMPVGRPFRAAEFFHKASREAVDQSLSRMVKKGELMRVARGVYVRPEKSKRLGALVPPVEKVVSLLAGAQIQVQGAEAAQRLGLTTQVPMKPVFWTSASSRTIHMGKMEVILKHVPQRKMLLAGRSAGSALAALWHLGQKEVTAQTIATIRARIGAVEFAELLAQRNQLPAWMNKLLRPFAMETNHA